MSTSKIGSGQLVTVPRNPGEELRTKVANDGHLDVSEVKELKKGWGSKPVTADAARELKQSVLGMANSIAPGKARQELQTFLEKKLPGMTAGPQVRDAWADLQTKALGDGRVSKSDAHALVRDWGSRPVTADEARNMTQAALSNTGVFASNSAIGVMQKFLQETLPGLVPAGELPRDFGTQLRVALMDDGHLDRADTGRLIDLWKKESFTPAEAKQLADAVLRNQSAVDPGGARDDLAAFIQNDLPGLTRNADGSPVRRDHGIDVRVKEFDDGKVDTREAKSLVREWDDPTTTPAEGEAIRQAVDGATKDTGAATVLKTFIDRNLPRLIVGQALTSPNNAKLTWTPPFANTDGTPLTNLSGYRIEYGNQPGVFDRTAQVDDPAATGLTIENLTPGTWYFRAISKTSEGAESAPSNEASKTVR